MTTAQFIVLSTFNKKGVSAKGRSYDFWSTLVEFDNGSRGHTKTRVNFPVKPDVGAVYECDVAFERTGQYDDVKPVFHEFRKAQ
jgi:hypothetical protein